MVIENPNEFNNTPAKLEAMLRGNPDYARRFAAIYGPDGIKADNVAASLAAFVMSLAHPRPSPYDRLREDWSALTPSQKRGLLLFAGKARCKSCHWTPDFTDGEFINDGLKPLADGEEVGRYGVTRAESDRRAIKVPSLRNIAMTAPYMHDGRFKTLAEVIDHYNRGGDRIKGQDIRLQPLSLTSGEKKDLENFLRSLTNPPDDGGVDFSATSSRSEEAHAPEPMEYQFVVPSMSKPDPSQKASAPRAGDSGVRCDQGFSPEKLMKDQAAGRFNEAESNFIDENASADLFKYFSYRAFLADDPGLCNQLGTKTIFNSRYNRTFYCRSRYVEIGLVRAMVARDPGFERICLSMADIDRAPKGAAAEMCRIMSKTADDPFGTCAKLLPRFMAPNSLRVCRYLFGPLKGETLDCAPFADSPLRTERCRMMNAYPKAYRAHDARLCAGSDECEVVMGEGPAVIARLADRIKGTVCRTEAPAGDGAKY
jgi:hypothetical protein